MEDGAATTRESTTTYTPVKLPPSSTTPRPHRCEICQRSFREIATLRKHEQLHRADRPYVCQTCGKSFLWSSNLKVHERVHTGERPYKCKICHRCFTQSNDLRRHERNVHMRGKLYGYKQGMVAAPGGGSHVNLAAYQAFAMQQRALLQQALTYESYLHTAAVTQGQMFPQAPPPLMQATKDGMAICLPSTADYDESDDHPQTSHASTPTPSTQPREDQHPDEAEESAATTVATTAAAAAAAAAAAVSFLRARDSSLSAEKEKYPACDSVMDLSMNKTPSRPASSSSDHERRRSSSSASMPPPKTPSSESECEGKRDVSTTSATPLADNGIHHCQHCNIFFYDYTMFHLHESLHMPYEDYPFRCPSCGKHCQDRIEFMFHTVWHVKYPHTIPNYEPFKDNFISS
ncbi:uncharacterized protein LOC143276832 [Babylonia areolata]|uniref:uncharacterized protein LOC143276832 n=1 Tax=Babylonia areolata TaxID=304850 RepID=UPI003FD2F9FA